MKVTLSRGERARAAARLFRRYLGSRQPVARLPLVRQAVLAVGDVPAAGARRCGLARLTAFWLPRLTAFWLPRLTAFWLPGLAALLRLRTRTRGGFGRPGALHSHGADPVPAAGQAFRRQPQASHGRR